MIFTGYKWKDSENDAMQHTSNFNIPISVSRTLQFSVVDRHENLNTQAALVVTANHR